MPTTRLASVPFRAAAVEALASASRAIDSAREGTSWLSAAAFALIAASPALAVDGAIEINHTCATTTGCVPTDGPGYPVVITAPGFYRLTSALEVPEAEDGIELSADQVTIDLNGFWIRGAFACDDPCAPAGRAGTGVLATGAGGDHSIVRNGGISGFPRDGVVLGANSRAEGLNLVAIGGDAIVLGGYGQANGNSIESIGGTGLVLALGSLYANNTIGIQGLSAAGGRASGPNSCADQTCGTSGKRFFYLTPTTQTALGADDACQAGFHMAAIWELAGLGALEYDTSRGLVNSESAQGPPTTDAFLATATGGWARPARVNYPTCLGWTSGSTVVTGTGASLLVESNGTPRWVTKEVPCSSALPVWCVQD